MISLLQTTLPLSRRLKELRKRIGLTQMELGVRAGIDESSASARINQYERGKHTPDFLTVCNLARVLGVDATYFYARDERLARLIDRFCKLPPNDQAMLIDLLDGLANGIKLEKTTS